jgi:putative pyruvate formate lyase activating enzyme
VRRLSTPDGETRLYLDPAGKLRTVNLTPTAARRLEALGFQAEDAHGWLALPPQVARAGLGQVGTGGEDLSRLSTEALWCLHDAPENPTGGASRLAVKLELARRLASPCNLCWHRCGADRARGQGWCLAPPAPTTVNYVLHTGEEVAGATLCLYLGPGCSHRCRFCTMHGLIHQQPSEALEAQEVAETIRSKWAERAQSVTLIGGEPGIYLPWILELAAALPELPLLWNSNMYHTPAVARLLSGVVDAYIADIKFGNSMCSRKLAGVSNYLEPVLANVVHAHQDGVPVVVRHVVMPGHAHCCTQPALAALHQARPDAKVHLIGYIPEWRGAEVGLADFCSDEELAWAKDLALSLGFEDVWLS